MICPSCGANVAESKFCENCGSPLAAASGMEPQDAFSPIGDSSSENSVLVADDLPESFQGDGQAGGSDPAEPVAPLDQFAPDELPTSHRPSGEAGDGEPADSLVALGQSAPDGPSMPAQGVWGEGNASMQREFPVADQPMPDSSMPAQGGAVPPGQMAPAPTVQVQGGAMPPMQGSTEPTAPMQGEYAPTEQMAPDPSGQYYQTAEIPVQQPYQGGQGAGQQYAGNVGMQGQPAMAYGAAPGMGGAVGGAPVSTQNTAPGTAFVLSVVGLVLAILTAIPGLICCIIALVLNAGYNSKGMYNPRKTPTMVLGIIGVVISVIFTISTVIAVSTIWNELVESGFDPDRIEAIIDGDTGSRARTGSSSTLPHGTTSTPGSASAAASPAAPYEKGFTADDNIALSLFLDHDGEQAVSILKDHGYAWSGSLGAYDSDRPDNVFWVTDTDSEDLTPTEIEALPLGGKGKAVVFRYWVDGFTNDSDAIEEVVDVAIEDRKVSDGCTYAIVENSAGTRYLAEFEDFDSGSTHIRVFTEEAIAEILEVSSIDEAYASV